MTNDKNILNNNGLKALSRQDFLNFGMREMAYIKSVQVYDRKAYAIHAADGTTLSIMESLDTALIAVRHNDLEPVTLH